MRRACSAPFPGREGKFVIKYFMLRHGARRRKSTKQLR
jgi:hypothetical protein